jgi:DNA-binding GntR family transcriptional regulator
MLVEGISSIDFSTASLYEVLEVAGAGPVAAQYTVWAAAADEKTASLLAIRPGEPVLMSSTSANDGHRLVETSVVVYRADRYRMRTTMSKRKPHNLPLMSGEL